jgi:hypothetical protein
VTSSAEYYQANREHHLAYMKAYYQRTRDHQLAKRKAWRVANPDKVREDNRKRYKKPTRAQTLMSKYGITEEERTRLFEASDGLCALCYEVPAVEIDHDHKTGRVRGAVCRNCNTGLGRFHDDPDMLHRAVEYLKG